MIFLPIFISIASSASHAPAPPKIEPPRAFDVKGVSPGVSFAEWLEKISDAKYKCVVLDESPGHTVKSCGMTGEPNCSMIGAKSFCLDEPKFDTFAGQQVVFEYKFHDDMLWEIDIHGIIPNAFESVVSTMETKYGKATVSKSDIQNRMGAHFEDESAIWTGANGIILYKKYSDKLDLPSKLTVYSSDGWKAIEATVQQNSERAKNDM